MKKGSSIESGRKSPQSVLIEFDPEGKIISCNDAAERVFGFTLQNIVGQKASIIFNQLNTDQPRIPPNITLPFQIDHSQVITYLQSPSGIFTYVSQTFQSLLGFPNHTVLGKSYREFVHPEDESSYKEWLEQLKNTGKRLEDFVYRLRSTDGTWHWFSTAASPVKDQNEHIVSFSGIARDITRQREAELDIRKTKQMFENIFNEISDVVVWSLSLPERKVKFITPSAKNLFERPIDQLMNDARWWEYTIHPEDKKMIPLSYRLLKKQGHYALHHRILTPQGKIKWVYNEGRLIKDSDNLIIRLDGLFFDRTDQFRAEDNLKHENSLQKILIDISSTYININLENVEPTIRKSLEEMANFVGADRAYIFDYNFSDNTTSNTYEWCAPGIQPEIENLQKIPLVYIPQWVSRHSKGEEFYVHDVYALPDEGEGCLRRILEPQGIKSLITFPMVSNVDLVGFVGFDSVRRHHHYSDKEKKLLELFAQMLINIRNRQKWERQITMQEEKFRNIITNINLGLLEVDGQDNILFANQGFCQISGYSLDEIKGVNITDLNLDEKYMEAFMDISGKGKRGQSVSREICVVNKQGRKKWWFVSGAPNFNDNGLRTGTIGIHLDITAQKELEQELARAKNSAEKASKAKELFLANMSHEIRTPLNVVIGMIRLLSKENLTEVQQQYVSQSAQAAQHLLTILNNVLDLTKIEAGEFTLDKKDFSLGALVANIKSMLYSEMTEKNLEFNLFAPSDLAPVFIGDEMRLKQVLLNLLGNAIKFTEKGCICLEISVTETTDQYQKVSFNVKDSGIGMHEWYISKIFEKFSQEQSSANRKYAGTGLGMAISRDLVQLMGGELTVKSQKGSGTEISFSLTFPLGNLDKINEKSTIINKDALSGYHILIVEDNLMNRFITRQSLLSGGCTVFEACDGKEAIQILETESFDLILMDIQMPEMDGVTATKYLRKKLGLETPVIALTANAFKHDIDMYLANGFNDYIIKPFDEQVFLKKILTHLDVGKTNSVQRVVKEEDTIRAATESTLVSTGSPLYDLASLKELSHGNDAFIREMLCIFISQVRESVVKFNEAYENEDMDAIRAMAHKLKPSIDHLGIYPLKEKIRLLEKKATSSNPEKVIQPLMNEIIRTLLLISDSIEKNELK